MATKVKGYRFNETTLNQLSKLCEIYGIEETTLLKRLVEQEYLRVNNVGKNEIRQKNKILKEIINNIVNIYEQS